MTLPPAHASAVLSDCATPDGSVYGALIGLGYSQPDAKAITLATLRAAYRFPGNEQPMPREVRVACALSHGGIA